MIAADSATTFASSVMIGDLPSGPQRVYRLQFGRRAIGLRVPLIKLDLVGKPQFLQQPQYAL
jgi:hypothetical protein